VEAPAPTLEEIFSLKRIRLNRSELFDRSPPALPADAWDRVEGMLLGLAIGDALGNPAEGLTASIRRQRFGEIRDYLFRLPDRETGVGLPSDDSQLAFWTLEHLLEVGGLVPEKLARKFASSRIFGIGQTVFTFLIHFRDENRPWYECGPESASNGALMRIAPTLVPHVGAPSAKLWSDVALAAMMTHNDAASTSACLAFAFLLWELMRMEKPPAPEWWWESYAEIARELEGNTSYQPRRPGLDFRGPLWRFVAEEVPRAWEEGLTPEEASDRWYSGAYLLETVPTVLFLLARHAGDPEEAIVRAVNDTMDNDTAGAIVGAAVGALHGRAGLPERWVSGLAGRTRENDDGRVFELIQKARERFGTQ
jgi:ADP-ribosylglycohydrolase